MFELLKTDSHTKARLGRLTTTHGVVDTPVFMPVGTQASVKALDPRELPRDGHANHPRQHLPSQHPARTRHHPRRRRAAPVHELGTADPHRQRRLPGFQPRQNPQNQSRTASNSVRTWTARCCFSARRKPWKSSACSARTSRWCSTNARRTTRPRKEQRLAVERTIRWARECREQPRADGQKVFGIVQGGSNAALREECAKALVAMDFDGYAIGGVSVGEPEPEMLKAIELTEPFLPAHKARYAMGLGTPAQMVELIARGVDMFDCVLPTRVARNGTAFTRRGAFGTQGRRLTRRIFGPIEEGCDCFACRTFHARLSAASAERRMKFSACAW